MTTDERRRLIARYAAGYEEVTKALDGFPAELQGEKPIRGKWSAREIVHHLADSETTSAIRLRKLIVEDHPLIQGYDQERWALLGDTKSTPVMTSLALVDALHERWSRLIAAMTDRDFARTFRHPEHGRSLSLDEMLALYSWHGRHHVAHITTLRDRMGW